MKPEDKDVNKAGQETASNALAKPGKPALGLAKKGSGGLHDRLREVRKAEAEGSGKPFVQLLLDCSGSMASADWSNPTLQNKQKIEILREAVEVFINEMDFNKYALAIRTFPPADRASEAPTSLKHLLLLTNSQLRAAGGTPMAHAIQQTLSALRKPERCVLVSDGEATDYPIELLEKLKQSKAQSEDAEPITIPVIDCVHIGSSDDGEETLKKVAALTGGVYLKFTDLQAFRSGFKFLTPTYRAMLTSGAAAALTGASEVKT